jgi:WD40 repeat protein
VAGCIKGIQSCQTYRIEMYDMQTGKTTGKSFEGSTNGNVRLLRFSPDGKKIGISTYKSLTPNDTWWDIESGQPDPLLNNLAVEWIRSPDGRYAVTIDCESGNGSGCGIGLITLWDVQKGQPVGQPIRNPDSSVTFQGFSPDGRFLYTSSITKMTVWSLDPADWLTRICQIVNRNLSQQEWSLYLDQATYHPTCTPVP